MTEKKLDDGSADARVKLSPLSIAVVFLPVLFPLWYSRSSTRRGKKEKLYYIFGLIWLYIWTAVLSTLIIPGVHPLDSPHSSDVVLQRNGISGYESRSSEYENQYYDKLKSSQINSTENINNSSDSGKVAINSATDRANNSSSISTSDKTNNTSNPSSLKQSQNAVGSMSGITIAEADSSPYNRSDYGSGWDVGTTCNIRATLLAASSTVQVQTSSNGCTVIYGSWVDPYSGLTLTGNPYQGDGTDNDLDIDHIIPLKYVNSHGGYAWSSSQKVSYGKSLTAMNNGVYIAVSSTENRKKSDKGPADYYPSNPDIIVNIQKNGGI